MRSFDLEKALPRLANHWSLAVLCLLASIVQQAMGHLNGDDSWFLTFAEKYQEGFVPYVDVTDPNPPAAFLAYLPPVLIAKWLATTPELVLAILTFIGAGASIWLSGTILQKASLLEAAERPRAVLAAIYLLLFVPAFCFAEREHIALLAILPMVMAGAARAARREIGLRDALLAGLGCGLACAFKPYYLVPAACVAGYIVFSRRQLSLLLAPEFLAAGGVIIVYVATIFLFFPAYFSQALPLVIDVYAPLRDTPEHIFGSSLFIANAAVLVALLYACRAAENQQRTLALAMASIGFLLTYVIQGKGWINHAYPGVALALLASASFLSANAGGAEGRTKLRRSFALFIFIPALCLAPFLFGTTKAFGNSEEYPGLAEAVRRAAPPHPKIIALAEQLDVGHPLVRTVGGTWVGRQNALWVSWGVRYLLSEGHATPAVRLKLKDRLRADVAMFAEDVDRGHPDVLLVESPQVAAWASSQPSLRGILKTYHWVENAGPIGIWLRSQKEARQ